MKKSMYFVLAFFAISILACQDGKDEAKSVPDLSYFLNVGKQIPTETGYRWMDVYRSRLKLAGRENSLGYSLSKENLALLSGSVESLIGVVFHNATDAAGQHHILIIPIDESLQVWSQDKTIIDANTDAPIAFEDARAWARNFQNESSGAIWYHFFGKHVFDELNALDFFEYIQIEPAISDINLSAQILLIVNDVSVNTSSGRSEYEATVVYDMSNPCPTDCNLAEN
jgi:hypothetical protein